MAQDATYMQTGAAPASDERTMAMLAHLGGILFWFLPALVIYLVKGKESQYVREQSVEALNFQITLTIAWVASVVLLFVLIGIILLPVVAIGGLVLMIMAGIAANRGDAYRYPLNIRIVKP